MHLKTSGKPSKIPIKECKDAVKFYSKYLMTEKLFNSLNVRIIFEDFPRKAKEYAFCEWKFANDRSRDFIITVDSKLSKKNILLALAHEIVHVKQYAKGELKDYLRSDKSKWQGTVFDLTKIDYWDQPWEIEAHGREIGLYIKFKRSQIKNVKPIKKDPIVVSL